MLNSLYYLTFIKRIASMDNLGSVFLVQHRIARQVHEMIISVILTCLFLGINNIRIYFIFQVYQLRSLAGRLSTGTYWFGPSESISQLPKCHKEPSQFEEPTKSLSGRVCSVCTSSPGNHKGRQTEALQVMFVSLQHGKAHSRVRVHQVLSAKH